MITFFFVVFSLQQTTWKASSSVIDDGYSKQMFREENQLCFSTAGFTAKLYRGGKATGVETHMKILTAQILLAYPRMTANKQSRTAQLGEIGIWPQIEAFSQKALQLQPVSAAIRVISQGLPHLFTRAISASFAFTTDCSCFSKGRLIPVLLMEWLSCWFSKALHTRSGLLRAGMSQPQSTAARLSLLQHKAPSPKDEFGHGSLPGSQHQKISIGWLGLWVHHQSKTLWWSQPSASQPGTSIKIRAISARTQTSFLHWERDKKRQLDPS